MKHCSSSASPSTLISRSRSLSVLFVACLITLIAGCATQLAGVFPDGQRLAETAAEWAGATVQRGGARLTAERGMTLQRGDTVMTDARSYALIRFESGAEAYLAPNSRGRIGSLVDFVGEVLVKVRGAFAVRTQYITAAAKGTVFLVRSGSDGVAEVIVLEGVVGVSSNAGRWSGLDLRAGEKARLVRDQPPARSAASANELEDIGRRYDPLERAAPLSEGSAAAIGVGVAAVIGVIIHNQTKDRRPRDEPATQPGSNTVPSTNSTPTQPQRPSRNTTKPGS